MGDRWQDWTPVVIKKPTPKPTPKPTKPKELDEIGKVQHTTLELRKQIQNARMAKKMSQADLAKEINEKPNVIQAYENGKAIPSTQILQKLRRVLGVKLTSPPNAT
jgi:putative transcription factor